MIAALIHDIATHKLLMLRALIVGLAAAIITGQVIVGPLVQAAMPNGFSASHPMFWDLLLTKWMPIHGAHGAFVGWVIARTHRQVRTAALAVFVVVGFLAVAPGLLRLALQQSPQFVPTLALASWPVVCIVASGLWLVKPVMAPAQVLETQNV